MVMAYLSQREINGYDIYESIGGIGLAYGMSHYGINGFAYGIYFFELVIIYIIEILSVLLRHDFNPVCDIMYIVIRF